MASVRLCMYWKFRKFLFGESRWLLPLNQTGRGALSQEDIEFLRRGFLMVIPRPNRGPLLLIERSKLPRTAGFHSTRLMFYLAVTFPHEMSHPDGVTVLYLTTSARIPDICLDKEMVTYVLTGLPMRTKQLCVAQAYEFGKEYVIEWLADMQARILEFQSGIPPLRVAENSVRGTLSSLKKLGLDRSHVPISLGGSLDESAQFAQWIRRRLSVEDGMAAAPLILDINNDNTTQRTVLASRLPIQVAAVCTQAASLVPKPSIRKRTYQRYNEMIADLGKQIDALNSKNGALRVQNRYLEGFVARVNAAVAQAQLCKPLNRREGDTIGMHHCSCRTLADGKTPEHHL